MLNVVFVIVFLFFFFFLLYTQGGIFSHHTQDAIRRYEVEKVNAT